MTNMAYTAEQLDLCCESVDLLFDAAEFLRHRVGNVYLVEVIDAPSLMLNDASGDTCGGAVFGHLLEYYRICGDLAVVSYRERTENLRARAYEDVISKCGVTLSNVLARTSDGNALIERAVVAYLGGLAYYDAHTVVDKQSLADSRAGVYLNAREMSCKLAYRARGEIVL